MKSIKYLILFTMTSALLWSCKKEEQHIVASPGTATSFSASVPSLILTKENAEDTLITFTWTKSDFGYQAAITNTIQFDVKGGDFSNAKEMAADVGLLSKSLTGVDVNTLLLSMDLPTGEPASIIVRLKTQITSSTMDPVYSDLVNLEATPFSLVSYLYVPGDYQGWNPASADSLTSPRSNGLYEGIIYFPNSEGASFEFKITTGKNWDNAYGDAGGGMISTSGDNLKAPGAGSYQIKVDMNSLSFEMLPFQFGIIGDATAGGWDSDTDMKYDNGQQVWTLTTHLNVGELKFRKNHDWGVNYGDDGHDGTLDAGGANIPIDSAGEYVIVLDLNTSTYSLTKK
jgi:hypothetical protein